MFEESLVASRGLPVSASKRWTALMSVGLQVTVVGVVIALPLWHPEGLPFRMEAPKVLMPLLPKPPVPRVVEQTTTSLSSAAAQSTTRPMIFPTLLPSRDAAPEAPSLAKIGPGMGVPDGVPNGLGVSAGNGPAVSVRPEPKPMGRVRISQGVSAGMLLAPIRPVYPMIAKAAGVQGTVIVEAVISRAGTIESLHVVSGPAMLQSAAIDAIREARYQPFRLNGEPVEVETKITVNFRIGG